MKTNKNSYAYLYIKKTIIHEITVYGSTCVGDVICLVGERFVTMAMTSEALHTLVHTTFADLVKLRRIEVVSERRDLSRGFYYQFTNALEQIVGALEDDECTTTP